ncbi:MBL fold metallo-hydrolase [Polyangium sp. 15x6]|uniref:MBL fold metallo-hydrolase n=1 Tax=Polyangium sp. 15x6 TaxID=3042687 RepID=UPI00249C86C7|nr:MBL fold metallo-hydrolase [Polyangium sp. 15x6]MDI3287027.1 MBL fold metallo-hydrolase [Polyangium sp. 15x6]
MRLFRSASNLLCVLFLGASLSACGGAASTSETAASGRAKPTSKTTRLEADPRIGVYTSVPWGFETNSFWIEGPKGLIVIDTQFLPSAAAELVERAESVTGKKVELAIVLHPNPDKFNGTSVFQKRGIKVVTSAQVIAQIPHVHEIRTRSFAERYAPDYPTELPRPESFGDATQELSAGGVTVKAHVLGAGCSEAHVVVEYDGHVFVGDLVGQGTHAWVEIGEIEAWIERLAEIAALKPKFVNPGRGKTAGADLLEWETGYLRRLLEEVAKEKPAMPPPAGAIDRVKDRMMKAYPGLDYDVFLDVGLEEVWRKQAAKAAAK